MNPLRDHAFRLAHEHPVWAFGAAFFAVVVLVEIIRPRREGE